MKKLAMVSILVGGLLGGVFLCNNSNYTSSAADVVETHHKPCCLAMEGRVVKEYVIRIKLSDKVIAALTNESN
ncbi:MAG: hypothetical protein J6F30_14090 [Cellulosilyticum sp.]|nr:hypothetical protein [Cellulosilyticum sp.]